MSVSFCEYVCRLPVAVCTGTSYEIFYVLYLYFVSIYSVLLPMFKLSTCTVHVCCTSQLTVVFMIVQVIVKLDDMITLYCKGAGKVYQ